MQLVFTSLRPASSCLCFLFFFLNIFMSSFFAGIHILLIKIFEHFVVIVLGAFIHFSRQQLRQLFQLFWCELSPLGHFYLELDDEIAEAHGILEEGHAQASNHLLFLVAQDLAFRGVDVEGGAVEMLHLEFEADQSLHQGDCFLHVEVGPFARECFVGFLLDHEDEVSSQCVRLNRRNVTISLP